MILCNPMHFGSQDIISTDTARFPALIRDFGNFPPKVTSFDPFLAKFTFADFPHFLGRFPHFLDALLGTRKETPSLFCFRQNHLERE